MTGCDSNAGSDEPRKGKHMSNNVSALLKKLSSVSQDLNEASNQLSEQIKSIEAALASQKLGVRAWVELRRTSEREKASDGRIYEITRVDSLGYDKHQGRWGLLVHSWIEEFVDPDDSDVSLLRDAPRELRMAAVDALPKLIQQIGEEALKLAKDVARKAEQAKSIAAVLNKKQH